MTKVNEQIEIKASPAAVWAIMGAPESIAEWHPAIATSPLIDGARHLTIEGGGEAVEPIVEHSDKDRYYVYTVASGPFPMKDYLSRVEVHEAAGGCRVVWTGEFEANDPDQADGIAQAFSGIYRGGLEGIRERAEAGA